MPPRPDRSRERIAQILDAALEVFARRGFHKARMDDIAQQAGLSKGALYLYFKSKNALIEGLVNRVFEREMHDLRAALDDHQAPVSERLRRIAERALADILPLRRVLPVMYEFYALAARPGVIRTSLQAYYRRYREMLGELIAEGMARGEFRPVDPDLMAVALIAQFEGLMLLWVIAPDEHDLPTLWNPVVDEFLRALQCEDPK